LAFVASRKGRVVFELLEGLESFVSSLHSLHREREREGERRERERERIVEKE
jgi:hypothetical protein